MLGLQLFLLAVVATVVLGTPVLPTPSVYQDIDQHLYQCTQSDLPTSRCSIVTKKFEVELGPKHPIPPPIENLREREEELYVEFDPYPPVTKGYQEDTYGPIYASAPRVPSPPFHLIESPRQQPQLEPPTTPPSTAILLQQPPIVKPRRKGCWRFIKTWISKCSGISKKCGNKGTKRG
jgi:hypothetical protein